MRTQLFSLPWWQAYAEQNQKKLLYGLLAFFGLIFLLIAIPNHYLFRTFAFDLGIFNNAIYDYAHFKWNDNPVKGYENILSDHFTLLHIPFSLFYWLFGSYTLVLIQVAAVLFGAFGAYKYHTLRTHSPLLSLLLLFQFLSIWGIYSAVAYDYHDNVVAAMLVPWFFYYFHQKKWLPTVAFFALILCSKENMALWAIFLNLGLAIIYFKDKQQLRLALLFSVIAAVYFIIVVKLVIPGLAVGDRSYGYIQSYTALGGNFTEILTTLFTRPLYVFGLLFQNHLNDPVANGIKWELHAMVLLSGGFALFFRPAYLLMLLPIFAQKLFINNFMIWGLNYQYSIELVPILNIALAEMIVRQPPRRGLIIAWIAVGLTFAANARSLDTRISKWFDRTAIQFFKAKHYRRQFDAGKAHQALKLIPDDAPVSALSPLVPHLAFRDYVFEFPYLGNASYIALIENEPPYKLTGTEYNKLVAALKKSEEWQIIYYEDSILILKRAASAPNTGKVIFE
jgi:uncharacterized membrane protein